MTVESAIAEAVRLVVREEVAALRAEVEQLRDEYRAEAVSIEEAAVRLHLSPRSIRRRIKDGTLPHLRVGGVLRVQVGRALPGPAARR